MAWRSPLLLRRLCCRVCARPCQGNVNPCNPKHFEQMERCAAVPPAEFRSRRNRKVSTTFIRFERDRQRCFVRNSLLLASTLIEPSGGARSSGGLGEVEFADLFE